MVCGFSFARDIKVIGVIPSPNTGKNYQLQVGAFSSLANANKASATLTKYGLVPQCEKVTDPKYGALTRVFVVVCAQNVRSTIALLGRAGFREVIIREYPCKAIVAKPEPEPKPEPKPLPPEPEPLPPEPKPLPPEPKPLPPEPKPLPPEPEPEPPYYDEFSEEELPPSRERPFLYLTEEPLRHLFLLLYSRDNTDTRRLKPVTLRGGK